MIEAPAALRRRSSAGRRRPTRPSGSAGRRALRDGRQGEAVPRSPVRVTDARSGRRGRGRPPRALDACSPGTYIRALARDLGERLGVGGHWSAASHPQRRLRPPRSRALEASGPSGPKPPEPHSARLLRAIFPRSSSPPKGSRPAAGGRRCRRAPNHARGDWVTLPAHPTSMLALTGRVGPGGPGARP